MEIRDSYRTIAGRSLGEFRDRGSKFIAYAFPVYSVEECQEALGNVRAEHPKARHYCYAYRLGLDQNNFRANDDGEPSGTAGRPILGRIDSAGLTNTIVIVVRYFGGTLLGASGLINAYKTSAEAALEAAEKITRIVEDVFTLQFDYAHLSKVMNAVSNLPMDVVEQRFDTTAELDVAIRQSEVENTIRHLKAKVAEVYLEEVDELEDIPGFAYSLSYTR